MKRRKHRINRKRLTALLLGAALVPALLLSLLLGGGSVAYAAGSLPYIDNLTQELASGGQFSILEIVPQAGAGSLGYYVAGQEPSSGWLNHLSTLPSPADRSAHMSSGANNGLFDTLETAGLMSAGTGTPLTKQSAYSEKYMWETGGEGYAPLVLDHAETVQVQGRMTAVPSGSPGRFRAEYAYNRVPDGTGDYILDIRNFAAEEYNPSDPPEFYYLPAFTELEAFATPPGGDGTAIYERAGDSYDYCGSWGDPDLELDSTIQYYYVDGIGAYGTLNPPVSSGAVYVPVINGAGDGFVFMGDGLGYYTREKTGKYFWAVDGSGNQSGDHELSAGTDTQVVEYDRVLYRGGYSNNHWFLKYVFDLTYSAGSGLTEAAYYARYDVRVNTVTPAQLTTSLINGADLIVLSAGYQPTGAVIPGYSGTNDISAGPAHLIYTLASRSANVPVVVDYRVANAATDSNLRKLSRFLIGASAGYEATAANFGAVSVPSGWDPTHKNHVDGNIYCYNPTGATTPPGYQALATSRFALNFLSDTGASMGFSAVVDEINYENFLKENAGDSYRLPVQITMANALRYVINYGHQRSIDAKTGLKVLEIQPRSGTQLTRDTVYSWLPAGSAVQRDDITIVTMSTAQFIGRIEDLNETYDMLYIGDSTTGFYLQSGATNFNDDDMDGLLYSNIGDTYLLSKFSAAGQLNREYYNANRNNNIINNSSAKTFRFSGNDITARAAQAIHDFAAAGYPVVFADSLMSPVQQSVTFTAAISGEFPSSGNSVVLSADISVLSGSMPSGVTYTYQWYRDGSSLGSGARNRTYTVDTGSGAYDRSFYCIVTATYGGTGYAVTSNTLRLTKTAANVTVITSDDQDKAAGTISVPATLSVTPGIQAERVGQDNKIRITGAVGNDSTIKSTLGSAGYTNITYRYTLQRATNNGFTSNLTTVATIANISNASYTFADQTKPSGGNNSYYYYRVQIAVFANGQQVSTSNAVSRYYSHRGNNNGSVSGSSGTATTGTISYTISGISMDVGVTPISGNAGSPQTLTASVTLSPSVSGVSYAYQWYRDGTSLGSGGRNRTYSAPTSGISVGSSVEYYCTVTANGSTARSNTVILTKQGVTKTVTDEGDGTERTISYTSSENATTQGNVNGDRVDNCTHLYQTMTDLKSRKNVVTVYEVLQNKPLFLSYLNLSKPKINLTVSPVQYRITNETSSSITMTSLAPENGVHILRYTFTISNDTDPTPASTTYHCQLFVDSNSDGLYSPSEVLNDIVVRRASTGALVIKTQGRYALKAGEEYTVTRQMPTDYVGILPWRLQVVKNGAEHIHASEHDYTRIAPTEASSAKTIKVLQIASGSSADDNTVLIEAQSTYTSLINKVNASGDFNIDISTVYNSGTRYRTYSGGKTTPSWASGANDSTIYNVLKQYDMLIIGFNDCYDGVGESLSQAIFTYIDSGKAVLFTHDTTSFSNTANKNLMVQGTSTYARDGEAHWGYYFNTVLRAPVGLDYYGISDTAVRNASNTTLSTLLRTGSTNTIASTAALQLANDYNVAYQPKSNKGELLDYTHGYTPYFLVSKGASNSSNNNMPYTNTMNGISRTTQVTQANEGQITTYPFNINTSAFGGSGNYLTVAETHEQYYRLNMNNEDIVVWYCLGYNEDSAPGYAQTRQSYGNIRNDVSNAYYIYTMGNITYSGVGHKEGVTQDEAKLFINTMVAAFRTTSSTPTVTIKNQDSTPVDYIYFTALNEAGEIIEKAYGNRDESRAVYFSFIDANLSGTKVMEAEFFYSTNPSTNYTNLNTTATKVPLAGENKIYLSTGGEAGNLAGGVNYKFFLPDSVLNTFELADKRTPFKIFVRITTTVNEVSLSGENSVASVELRKIGLLGLT